MDDLKKKVQGLSSDIGNYLDTYYEITLVRITKKASNIAGNITHYILVGLLLFFVVLFTGFALGWWLGSLLDSQAAGFLFVALIYLLLTVIIYLTRKRFIVPFIRNLVVRNIYED